jgi:hypothetical protein
MCNINQSIEYLISMVFAGKHFRSNLKFGKKTCSVDKGDIASLGRRGAGWKVNA